MSGVLEIFDSKIKIVKWNLTNFSPEVSSPHFTLEDKNYYIGVKNITLYDSEPTFELHLSAVDEEMKINFDFDIGVEKSDGSVSTVKNGPFYCFRREYEQNFIPLDIGFSSWYITYLTVVCIIYHRYEPEKILGNCCATKVKEASSQTDSLECIEQLSQNMKELFTNSRHADIIIKVGNKEFRVHKSVLSARSPVLESMFSHQMLENKTGILTISDSDEGAFEAFLMFLYTGKIDEILISKVAGLYGIADKYDMKELKTECVKRLIIEMSTELVCDALLLATLYEEKILLETATKYFIDNVEEILDTEKWESFSKDHFKFGKELLKECFSARPK